MPKFIVTEILYNGHLQSLGAASIVYISSLLVLDKDAGLELLFLVYLIFQSIFLFDRYKDFKLDRLTNRQRTEHLRPYLKRIPLILVLLLFAIAALLLYLANAKSSLFALLIIILGFFYPIYFKRLTKKIYIFKNIYVSFVYALMVYFPLVYYSTKLLAYNFSVILFSLVFAESLVNQVSLDLKDTKTDKKEKLLTLPILLGKERTLNLLRYASLALGVFFAYLSSLLRLNFLFMLLVVVNILINQLFINMIYQGKKQGYVLSAGKFLLWFFIVLTIRIFI